MDDVRLSGMGRRSGPLRRSFAIDGSKRRSTRRTVTSRLVFVLGSLCSPVVSAQSGGVELDRNAEAVADGRRGLAAWQSGDYAACRKSFSRAESISHSPVFVLYLARC